MEGISSEAFVLGCSAIGAGLQLSQVSDLVLGQGIAAGYGTSGSRT